MRLRFQAQALLVLDVILLYLKTRGLLMVTQANLYHCGKPRKGVSQVHRNKRRELSTMIFNFPNFVKLKNYKNSTDDIETADLEGETGTQWITNIMTIFHTLHFT
jgi:hypothetical protein